MQWCPTASQDHLVPDVESKLKMWTPQHHARQHHLLFILSKETMMRQRDMIATKKQVPARARGTAVLQHAVGPELAEPVESCAAGIQPNARSPAPGLSVRIS